MKPSERSECPSAASGEWGVGSGEWGFRELWLIKALGVRLNCIAYIALKCVIQ
jgi:hypothetical protein